MPISICKKTQIKGSYASRPLKFCIDMLRPKVHSVIWQNRESSAHTMPFSGFPGILPGSQYGYGAGV